MKQLTITATGGLCNRMRVLASVYYAAPHLHHRVRLVWRSTSECKACFDDLFQPLPETRMVLDSGSWLDSPANRSNLRLPALFRFLRGFHEKRDFLPPCGFSLHDLSSCHSYFFDTCQCLESYPSTLPIQIFRPQSVLQYAIDQTVSAFDDKTIGVHIRRTDNVKSILHSPLEAFIRRLDELIDTGHAGKIFLCTDDEKVRTSFQLRYGKRLICRDICLQRAKLSGICDAVVDLWSLSQTSYLIGSYYSSFSDTASELTGIPHEIINIAP